MIEFVIPELAVEALVHLGFIHVFGGGDMFAGGNPFFDRCFSRCRGMRVSTASCPILDRVLQDDCLRFPRASTDQMRLGSKPTNFTFPASPFLFERLEHAGAVGFERQNTAVH